MTGRIGPEIIVGLVGALGSPLEAAEDVIRASVARFGYNSTPVRLSQFLDLIPEGTDIRKANEVERLETSMKAGTRLRQRLGRGDPLVAFAAMSMRVRRRELCGADSRAADSHPPPIPNHCFIIRSLKHPEELERLRQIYGHQFICIGIYSSRVQRVDNLAERLAHSAGKKASELRSQAECLIQVDEKESGTDLGQDLRDTFPLADVFISSNRLHREIDRVFDLLFGKPFVTPTRDEQAMFFAQAAAVRSAALARQVGACITNSEGDILAVGCNEVPKAFGGQYWEGDTGDARDFVHGHDRNDRLKQRIVREVLTQIKESKWLVEALRTESLDALVASVNSRDAETKPIAGAPRLRETLLASLTEFGRDVHAEMSALTTLARLPIAAKGCSLYCTTFPCHNCAKHIISSGIERVVYIEPYPKSFALEFHQESVVLDGDSKPNNCVSFDSFSGVAPQKYLAWFRSGRRKTEYGQVRPWSPTAAQPIFISPEVGGYSPADMDLEASLMQEVLAKALANGDTRRQSGGQ